MSLFCINCGEEISDPRPGIIRNIYATTPRPLSEETINNLLSVSQTLYCESCEKEAGRLTKQAQMIQFAVFKQQEEDFKRFGYERRNTRDSQGKE